MINQSDLELRALLEKEHDTTGVIKALVLAASILAILIASKAYYSGHVMYALLLAGFAVMMIANMLVLQRTRNNQAFQFSFSLRSGYFTLF